MSEYSHNPLKTADSSNHGNHLNGLSTRQDRALVALLESPSIVAAARKAEVGESTLRQSLREDEDFQAMLRLIRHSDLTGSVDSLDSARKDQEYCTRSLSHRTKIADFLPISCSRDHFRPQLVGAEIFCGTDS